MYKPNASYSKDAPGKYTWHVYMQKNTVCANVLYFSTYTRKQAIQYEWRLCKNVLKKYTNWRLLFFTWCNLQTVLGLIRDRCPWLNFAIFPASRKKDKTHGNARMSGIVVLKLRYRLRTSATYRLSMSGAGIFIEKHAVNEHTVFCFNFENYWIWAR